MNTAIKTSPTVWSYTYRGELHALSGRDDLAIADLNEAQRRSPTSQEMTVIHYRRAQASFRQQSYEQAIADLTDWAQLVPAAEALSVLTAIPQESLSMCSDPTFRKGMRELADHLVERNQQSAQSLKARADLLRSFGE
ncbi:MAG: hypothetical protein R3C20_04260 [Planctomycetaceae bacterium]